MEYRSLGRTGVKVSPLCLGCWMFGDRASKEESVSILNTAFDAGINFLDTSNVYGGEIGRSESIIGEVVKAKGNRDNLVIATKVYFPVDLEDPNGRGISRRSIIAECEKSLRRLGSDYIDLYYMHRLDPEVPVDEPLRALDDLIRQGKVRYIGTSTTRSLAVRRVALGLEGGSASTASSPRRRRTTCWTGASRRSSSRWPRPSGWRSTPGRRSPVAS